MRVKYVGPLDAVDVAELGITVEHGDIIDVDDAIGKRLGESADWQITSRKKGDD